VEIYIKERVYAFNQEYDFMLNPSPHTVYEIDTEDIKSMDELVAVLPEELKIVKES
jgi:hypothetical protein